MGVLDFLKRQRVPNVEIIEKETDSYNSSIVGSIEIPDRLSEVNAFVLANTVTEIYFPIDFIADRASKLKFIITDKNGNEVTNPEFTRFITNPNPFYSFSDLVYQWIFSYLASGNAIMYRQIPSLYSAQSYSNISRIDVLNAIDLALYEYSNINVLDATKEADFIRYAKYLSGNIGSKDLIIDNLSINQIDSTRISTSNVLARSPLFKAVRPINNLLATYSARYNVYANNGAAGYLVKKSGGQSSQQEAINPITRDEMLKDVNQRNGITGRRNFWGISSIPLEFINTLAHIKDLMPFEETLEDSVKIASVFQIPSGLVPRKDQSTYDNVASDERKVWENTIMSCVETCIDDITKFTMMDKAGNKITADYSSVSCLKANEGQEADTQRKIIDNNTLLYEKGIITYNAYLTEIGQPTIEGGDKYIYDMTKVPYSTKLGVGGTQALQEIIADPNISALTKRNTLVVVFGFTEEEASKIITI